MYAPQHPSKKSRRQAALRQNRRFGCRVVKIRKTVDEITSCDSHRSQTSFRKHSDFSGRPACTKSFQQSPCVMCHLLHRVVRKMRPASRRHSLPLLQHRAHRRSVLREKFPRACAVRVVPVQQAADVRSQRMVNNLLVSIFLELGRISESSNIASDVNSN